MSSDVLVLVEPEHAVSAPGMWHSEAREVVENDSDIASALERFEGEQVVLHGGDGFVSRVLSTWFADRDRRVRNVSWTAVPLGEGCSVARMHHDMKPGAFARSWRKKQGKSELKAKPTETLALVDSLLPFRRVGFTAGFGILRDVEVSGLASLTERAIEGAESDEFRWAVDGSPQRTTQFLLVSALDKVGGTLGMGQGITYRSGDSLAGLLPQATRVGRLVSKATGAGAAQAFDRIHIDGASGYLLDGIALESTEAAVLELRSGPRPRFAQLG